VSLRCKRAAECFINRAVQFVPPNLQATIVQQREQIGMLQRAVEVEKQLFSFCHQALDSIAASSSAKEEDQDFRKVVATTIVPKINELIRGLYNKSIVDVEDVQMLVTLSENVLVAISCVKGKKQDLPNWYSYNVTGYIRKVNEELKKWLGELQQHYK
jgi:hypothetical protein